VQSGGFIPNGVRLETIARSKQDRFGKAGLTGGRIEDFGAAGRDRERGALV
jgi:hypothetical protein